MFVRSETLFEGDLCLEIVHLHAELFTVKKCVVTVTQRCVSIGTIATFTEQYTDYSTDMTYSCAMYNDSFLTVFYMYLLPPPQCLPVTCATDLPLGRGNSSGGEDGCHC